MIEVKDIEKVAVIGAGIMGEGIAQSFAQASLLVKIVDTNNDILAKCLNQIDANLRLFAEYGLLREEPSLILSRIEPMVSHDIHETTKDCQFVIECIPEVLHLKRELFAQLDACRQDIILSSNTSSFTITAITNGMSTPGRIVGTHYFNPAYIIPLVEIHRGQHTANNVVQLARELMLKVGKKPILVRKELPGFIVNRIQTAIGREASYLIEQGAVTAEDLDMAAIASYGFRTACLGPLQQADLNGLDTTTRASQQIIKDLCNRTEPSPLVLEKISKGELGVKTGRGWYDYTGQSKEQIREERDRKLIRQLKIL
jgi:3-hydroxybutyryl-CoA dehydrogenase